MTRRLIALALVTLLSATARPCAAASEPVDLTPEIAQRIDAGVRAASGSTKGLSPALAVAVVERGRLVYERAFGVTDVAAKTPATTATRFRIASVTKMFTAVAVMQLAERGRIELDDPLAKYLPAAPHAAEVTIRQLLMHTSGIWNYGDEAINSGRVAVPTTRAAIVASVAAHPLDAKPGEKFSYSNTGYVLLGLVVEAVTREPLARYEREHIFAPAGMKATTFGEALPGLPVALGYMDATGTAAPPFSPSWFYADGDIVSTAADLARFDIALMDGRLVKPATFAQMQSSAVAAPSLGQGARYGLGLTLVTASGVSFVGHHGGVPGFEAENELLPPDRYAIVVLSNAFDFHTAVVNGAVMQQTHPDLFAKRAAARPAPAAEDPQISAKLRTLIAGLQQGKLDRSSVTDAMNAALTPQALSASAAQLAPLGTLQSLTFRSQERVGEYAVHHYGATFSSGQTLPVTISIDKDGKVAGLGFS
jgi:D-alanyl-D-alanine carboxypeptidase